MTELRKEQIVGRNLHELSILTQTEHESFIKDLTEYGCIKNRIDTLHSKMEQRRTSSTHQK